MYSSAIKLRKHMLIQGKAVVLDDIESISLNPTGLYIEIVFKPESDYQAVMQFPYRTEERARVVSEKLMEAWLWVLAGINTGGEMPSESNQLTVADLEKFVMIVENRRTLNFPMLCAELEWSWPELRNHLQNNKVFREELTQVMERMSYAIHDNYLKGALGMDENVKLPPITAVKYITSILSSGVLFGDKEETTQADGSELDEGALREKLGL